MNVNRETGFALIAVLVLLAAATLLGASYMNSASLKLHSSLNMAAVSRAKFMAESGIDHAWCLLLEAPELLTGTENAPHGPYYVDESDDSYTFWVDQTEADSGLYTFWATGRADGITRRMGVTVYYGQVFPDMLLSNSPHHYWRLDEHDPGDGDVGSILAEDSAHNKNGWYVNGPLLGQPGALEGGNGHSVEFDGVDDHVDLGKITIGGQELSLVAWVRFVETDDDEVILARTSASGKVYWELATQARDGRRELTFSVRASGQLSTLAGTGHSISAGEWHLVSGVYDGSRMNLYLDGQLVAQRSKSGALDQGHQTVLLVGARHAPNTVEDSWRGWIDEVGILSTVLAPQEVESLYGLRTPSIEVMKWHD